MTVDSYRKSAIGKLRELNLNPIFMTRTINAKLHAESLVSGIEEEPKIASTGKEWTSTEVRDLRWLVEQRGYSYSQCSQFFNNDPSLHNRTDAACYKKARHIGLKSWNTPQMAEA